MTDYMDSSDFLSHNAEHLVKLIDMIAKLGVMTSSGDELDGVMELILKSAKELSNADGGTLYIMSEDGTRLQFSIMLNDSLDIYDGGLSPRPITLPPLMLNDANTGEPNYKNIATYCALKKEVVNIADAYNAPDFDFTGTFDFDKITHYHSTSFLTIPLLSNECKVLAVVQLINARDRENNTIPFDNETQLVVHTLCAIAGLMMENQRLRLSNNQMMESFIRIVAQAIDSKSPYDGMHCQRVPSLVTKIASALCFDGYDEFRGFTLSDDEWYMLHLASWLHDMGKITTPEYLMDKATKLETVYNRIHEIRARFEILRRDAHIEYLQKRLKNEESQEELLKEFEQKVAKLVSDFEFIASLNTGEKPVSAEDLRRLEEIAGITYKRTFDKKLGLSYEERDRAGKIIPNPPVDEYLLDDKPEQIFKQYNRGELYNLSIPRGTLTKEEKRKIDDHVITTVQMLDMMHFPDRLTDVKEYASNHHERMDGSGFPLGLKGDEMSIPARILAIADTFEALTAYDKPYRVPKKLSEALAEMADMVSAGKFDKNIFNAFVKSKVYEEYAEQYMHPDQIDEVDPEKYIVP